MFCNSCNAKLGLNGGSDDNWYLDSCCTNHVIFQRNVFASLESLKMPQTITTFEEITVEAVAKGTVVLSNAAGNEVVELEIHNIG